MAEARDSRNDAKGQSLPSALDHPLGSQILSLLGERGFASAKQIAGELSESRSSVSERLRRMRDDGLVEVVESKERRGAIERFYRPTETSFLMDPDEYAVLSESRKKRLTLRLVQDFANKVKAALSPTGPPLRDDSCWFLITGRVDAQGWEELVAIHHRALDEAERVRRESRARLEESGAGSSVICSSGFLFELPKP
jgi:DNA-binding transcriptional ArsR family regulator